MTFADFSIKRYRKWIIPTVVLFGLIQITSWACDASIYRLQHGLWEGIKFVAIMFPPDWDAFPEMLEPALQSIILAFLATVLGSILALVFGLMAASNISHPIIRNISRFIIGVERSLPEIIILLIIIAAYGLGMFPAIIALTLGCIGMIGKLLADAIEEIDHAMIESIQSVGANKLQVIWFGVLPQVLPNLISYALFRLEINVRLSVILGAVGAGGIGYELNYSFGLLQFHRALRAVVHIYP
jgi:phosphonate transport system permease protein